MDGDLRSLLQDIAELRRGTWSGRAKPHKLVMLLTVLDLAETGRLEDNRIYFDEELQATFCNRFTDLCDRSDWCQPGPPFFHLRSAPFWHHKIRPGREPAYANMTTSGGGSRRILDTIEYAYLSDYAWRAVSDPVARRVLRNRLYEMGRGMEKQSIAFHESFYLKTPSLAQVLNLAAMNSGASLTFGEIHDGTFLGRNQVKAFRRYAKLAGLLDDNEQPTAFGRLAQRLDPGLRHPATQWVIHYHMVAPHRNGPAFWCHLAERFFRSGTSFGCRDVTDELQEFVAGTSERAISARTLRTTATIFVGSYAQSDALSALGILGKPDPVSDEYEVQEPTPPAWPVLAYALADYWRGVWGGQKTVNLDEVTAPGGPAGLLLLGSGAARLLLREAQGRGLLQMQRAVAPYHIERMWDDPDALLEYLYA
ncbi:MAG: DUF4007 family protein [Armatimonadetes bacterium]|nr:DUF4007 family protein [Armatimonadota bacterium]